MQKEDKLHLFICNQFSPFALSALQMYYSNLWSIFYFFLHLFGLWPNHKKAK